MTVVTTGARTDVGCRRPLNEDSILVGRQIWAVADGMGGHAAGDVASCIVVDTLAELDLVEALKPADVTAGVARANERVLRFGAANPDSAGMGSTVTGLARVFVWGTEHWAIFNVGDSRVYRCFGGIMARATVDHSETEELILGGRLTEMAARRHSQRNVITRSVGSDPAPQVDLWVLPQTPGERFLVCSDGLTTELTDEAIAEVIVGEPDPERAAETLLRLALAEQARDNVSVIVVDVASSDETVDETTQPRVSVMRES